MLSDLSGVMHSKIIPGGGNDCKRWISHQIKNLINHTKSENAKSETPTYMFHPHYYFVFVVIFPILSLTMIEFLCRPNLSNMVDVTTSSNPQQK
jgi:hypothetical protein